jgi:hypothetical protein
MIAAGIAERTADFGNALRERILGDGHAGPIDVQQFVLGDDAPGIGREVPQHAERSVPQIDPQTFGVAQFLAPQVERQTGEPKSIHAGEAARPDVLWDFVHAVPRIESGYQVRNRRMRRSDCAGKAAAIPNQRNFGAI